MRSFQAGALLFCLCCVPTLFAQKKETLDENDPAQLYEDKHVMGVLPNYRTAEMTDEYHPISARYKLHIAFKDSFDAPLYVIGSVYAGIYQLENSHPQFGQGMEGYFKRFATSSSDQVLGNLMTEGIMPVLLREDPRYFRLGHGGAGKRVLYSLSRLFLTKTDSGHTTFNFAEITGNGISTAIGLAYYSDNRTFKDYGQNWGVQVATDGFAQILKEFWPDWKRRYQKKHGLDDTTPLGAGVAPAGSK